MPSFEAVVRGVRRNVLIEKSLPRPSCGLIAESYRARVNVGQRTVSGVFNVYNSGIRRFIPNADGANADVL